MNIKERKYCIYKHTNLINGKIYIGQTCKKPEYRWGANGCRYENCPKFWNAIQKYGWDNFSHEIIEVNLTQEQANEREIYWIAFYDSFHNGYNMTEGGQNWPDWTEEKRKQQSEMVRELWQNEEYKQKHSQKAKEKWQDPEFREKQIKTRNSPNFKQKMSQKRKELWEKHPEKKEENNQRLRDLWKDPEYRKKKTKRVICEETKEIFNSVKEAANWVGVKPNTLSTALRSKTHKSGKHPDTGQPLHWYYYIEEEDE